MCLHIYSHFLSVFLEYQTSRFCHTTAVNFISLLTFAAQICFILLLSIDIPQNTGRRYISTARMLVKKIQYLTVIYILTKWKGTGPYGM